MYRVSRIIADSVERTAFSVERGVRKRKRQKKTGKICISYLAGIQFIESASSLRF